MFSILENKLIKFLVLIAVILFSLSIIFGIPYILTLIGLAAWTAFGHLITLDDDAPGGWSNIDDSKEFWLQSKKELKIKFAIFFFLIAILVIFPSIATFGK